MSTVAYKWNPYRVFVIRYSVFGNTGRAVSYKQTASKAVEDVRERLIWSHHHTFKITKVECKEYKRKH